MSSIEPNSIITFIFVGYASQEVTVGSQSNLEIYLIAENQQLNEVVVKALGIKKEARTIGYTTQDVKGSQLVKAREPNAINSLGGKVAGLTVGASAELLGRPQLVLCGRTDLLLSWMAYLSIPILRIFQPMILKPTPC